MPESPTIHFGCPHCGRDIKVKAEVAGRRCPCPNPQCRQQIVVPSSDQPVSEVRRASGWQVFISYSAKDSKWGVDVCAAVETLNIDCWIAPRDIVPGTEWGDAIIRAIDSCKVMVLVFSAHANDSPQVRREVERAIHKGLAIVPFRVENVIPSGAMEYALSNTHWLDAFTPPMDEKMRHLAQAVQAHLQGGAKAAPAKAQQSSSAPSAAPSRAPSLLITSVISVLMLAGCAGLAFLGWRMFPSGPKEIPQDRKELTEVREKQNDNSKDTPKISLRPQFLEEDFREAFKNSKPLPDGWKNDAFKVAKDTNGKACLRVVEKIGEHFVEVPVFPLTRMFFIEAEFVIFRQYMAGEYYLQTLTIELDCRKGGKKLRAVISSSDGWVTVGNKLALKPQNYKVNFINTIRLERRDDNISVDINGERVNGVLAFSGLAEFDIVRIGLVAGESQGWARLYSVLVGTLPP